MTTTFDPELTKMLRCPVTKSVLVLATDQQLNSINDQIEAGTLVNRIGQSVAKKFEGGFVNADQTLFLPIQGGIVILVVDQAIPMS